MPTPAIFIDRDGTINKEVSYLNNIQHFKLLPRVTTAIKTINQSGYLAVVVTNQSAIARGMLTIEKLHQIHERMQHNLGKGQAYLDKIYFCPHHYDVNIKSKASNDSFIMNCSCRKPDTGMILQATKDLDIDLSKSWLIGDTTVDIMTAKSAKIQSILVETGYAGKEHRYQVSPDYICKDLYAAVNLIFA